ncbi:hypothetical protein EMCRGX_G017835 [Ephydatia muelleri]
MSNQDKCGIQYMHDQPRQKKKRRVYYGQMKTLRCMANQRDHDDSIVKHKLATTAVREKPSTSAARVVEARARLPRGLC